MRKSEIDWTFDHDIPTMSFFEDVNPDDPGAPRFAPVAMTIDQD